MVDAYREKIGTLTQWYKKLAVAYCNFWLRIVMIIARDPVAQQDRAMDS
jgi:hypothetical protein